jgi:23S rRNA pseudouridine2605 synthase
VYPNVVKRLLAGVTLEDGPVTVSSVKLVGGQGTARDGSILELVIHEGRNRIVRRLLDEVGHPVRQLSRTAIGPVALGQLGVGEMRELTNDELGALLDAASM